MSQITVYINRGRREPLRRDMAQDALLLALACRRLQLPDVWGDCPATIFDSVAKLDAGGALQSVTITTDDLSSGSALRPGELALDR